MIPLLVQRREAAALCGVSVDFFDEHIRPDLPEIPRGQLVLFRVRDIEDWIERSAVSTFHLFCGVAA